MFLERLPIAWATVCRNTFVVTFLPTAREGYVFTGVFFCPQGDRIYLVPGPFPGVGYLYHTLPGVEATAVVGTHPTGMLSCSRL